MLSSLPLLALAGATLATAQAPAQTSPYESTMELLINQDCLPSIPDGQVKAPCVMAGLIMNICKANGTTPEHLAAHRDCICGGSYFQEEKGCRDCHQYHGFRGEADTIHWDNIFKDASDAFCKAKPPTGNWQNVYEKFNAAKPYDPNMENNEHVDSGHGNSTVSLYYTPEKKQGHGEFTPVPPAGPQSSESEGTAVAGDEPVVIQISGSVGFDLWISHLGKTEAGAEPAAVPEEVVAPAPEECEDAETAATPTTLVHKPQSSKFANVTAHHDVVPGAAKTDKTPEVHLSVNVTTIVQSYECKCSRVLVGGHINMACTKDRVVPNTQVEAPPADLVAKIPFFPKDCPKQDLTLRQKRELVIPSERINSVSIKIPTSVVFFPGCTGDAGPCRDPSAPKALKAIDAPVAVAPGNAAPGNAPHEAPNSVAPGSGAPVAPGSVAPGNAPHEAPNSVAPGSAAPVAQGAETLGCPECSGSPAVAPPASVADSGPYTGTTTGFGNDTAPVVTAGASAVKASTSLVLVALVAIKALF